MSDQLNCKKCDTIIPKKMTKCLNSDCPTNKPIYSKEYQYIKMNKNNI